MLGFLSRLFNRPSPSTPDQTTQTQSTPIEEGQEKTLSDLELLQQAEEMVKKQREKESEEFQKSQPKRNTSPGSFGYVGNPFRDTSVTPASPVGDPVQQ